MVSMKSVFKLLSVMILSFSAVFISSIFLNYSYDLKGVEYLISNNQERAVYDALTIQNKISIAATGGLLGAVTLIVLFFSIAHFIQESSAELGVLKALGYSENKLALSFAKFGLSVLIGAVLGYIATVFTAKIFYNAFDNGGLPKTIRFSFHIQTPLYTVIVPSLLSSGLAVCYARWLLSKEPLTLIKGEKKTRVSNLTRRLQTKRNKQPFLKELQMNLLFSNLVLIFFVGFAACCFSAVVQMAFMMYDVTESLLTPTVIVAFGTLTGLVILLLALSFITKKNVKYLAMLKAYGYTDQERNKAVLGGYRIVTYIGFAIGTVVQYFFMKAMITVFSAAHELPKVNFHIVGFLVTLATFFIIYELIMFYYKWRIKRIPLQEIMQE